MQCSEIPQGSLTRRGSLVRTQHRPLIKCLEQRAQGSLEDPDGYEDESFSLEIKSEDLLYRYHKHFADFLDLGEGEMETRSVRDRVYLPRRVEEADLRIGMSQAAYRTTSDPQVEMNITNLSPRLCEDLPENIATGRDGIYLELGSSWSSDKMMRHPTLRGF